MLVSEQNSNRIIVLDGWRNRFNRGDANNDTDVDISDPLFIMGWLFLGGTEPPCLDAADANDNSDIDISDGVFLLIFLFSGGPAPPAPFFGQDPSEGQCGTDPTIDLLGCLSFALGNCAVTF